MPSVSVQASELDFIVSSFEHAIEAGRQTDFTQFLPSDDHPEYEPILVELVRVELEHDWRRLRPTSVDEYLNRFPVLRAKRESLEAICFEEYRQKVQAGKQSDPEEYGRRYGITTVDWPRLQSFSTARSLSKVHVADIGKFPNVGEEFLDYELVDELGRGSFGRVYLARQSGLSNRLVALKISRRRYSDSQTLARLQHTHIVPIYSVHRQGEMEAICMPYFGARTLGDLLRTLRNQIKLPASGRAIFDTIVMARDKTLIGLDGSQADVGRSSPAGRNPLETARGLNELGELSFGDAVLLIGKKLASGLAYAHERGIVHRDLKPVNILLSDDGEPMLLDFNLSYVASESVPESLELIGGTLPYMAPEQLQAFQQRKSSSDPRSDIFSLGIILAELLTGSSPFPLRNGALDKVIDDSLRDRMRPPPSFQKQSLIVSPAMEAILHKCLEPDITDRYQSAQHLVDDLTCQLQHLPLRHVREPSWSERARKWGRRHPRLLSTSGVGAISLLLLLIMASMLMARNQRLAYFQSQATWESFQTRFLEAKTHVAEASVAGIHGVDQAIQVCEDALRLLGIANDTNWKNSLLFRHLSSEQQAAFPIDIGELYFLSATAHGLKADFGTCSDDHIQQIELALKANRLAASMTTDVGLLHSISSQARWLRGEKNNRANTEQLDEGKEPSFSLSARALCRRACLAASQRRYREAADWWQQATMADPTDIWAWFGLGHSLEQLMNPGRAAECYSACIALNADYFGWYFNRGRIRLQLGDFALARDDFQRSSDLNPTHAESQVNLAISLLELKDFAASIHAMQFAIDLGFVEPQAFLVLSQAYEGQGNSVVAGEMRAKAHRCVPTKVQSWIARGCSRVMLEPWAAISDFDEALKLNVHSLEALESKAHVLAERLNLNREAVAVMDKAVDFFPERADLLATRGVLRARLNERTMASNDAKRALILDESPRIQYLVAGIYALLSKESPPDGQRAIELLTSTLRQGFGANSIGSDPDLEAIRMMPEYMQLRDAVNVLSSSGVE